MTQNTPDILLRTPSATFRTSKSSEPRFGLFTCEAFFIKKPRDAVKLAPALSSAKAIEHTVILKVHTIATRFRNDLRYPHDSLIFPSGERGEVIACFWRFGPLRWKVGFGRSRFLGASFCLILLAHSCFRSEKLFHYTSSRADQS